MAPDNRGRQQRFGFGASVGGPVSIGGWVTTADNTNTTTVHTVEVVRYDDPLIITERVAVAAFLAGYTDPTRQSYATDLRIFATCVTTMASIC